MNSVNLFLKTEIEGTGLLSWVGNCGLAPYRYLFNGKTVRVETDKNNQVHVHHVTSFHTEGEYHHSKTDWDLKSEETAFYKLVLAIVLLIPGLILSVCKALSYFFDDVQEKNAFAQQHFTPINRTIGTKEVPITNEDQLKDALWAEKFKPLNQRTNAIIIYGDGNLKINAEPGILHFNPAKIILVGAKVIHASCGRERLDDAMISSGKWKDTEMFRVATSANPEQAGAGTQTADSVDSALNEPNPSRGCFTGKTFHMLYQLKA